jgi:hypothetical protein
MVTTFDITAVTMDGRIAEDYRGWKLFVANAYTGNPSNPNMIRGFEYQPQPTSGLLVGTAECAPGADSCGPGGKFGVGW